MTRKRRNAMLMGLACLLIHVSIPHSVNAHRLASAGVGPAETKAKGVQSPHLVRYDGPVEHIFFHPLIAYPQLAFDGDSLSRGYNDWFITVPEFDKILDSLYKKHFILVDIRDTFTLKTVGGRSLIFKKALMIPKGTKPIIISIDDMNYYDYMRKNGNVWRLVLDKNGSVATESVTPQGTRVISHDNDIVPILDAFVAKHPDFSLNGAKGMINLTGYEGVLGYRTNDTHSPHYAAEKAAALKVIQRLKATGWTFACHGYGHLADASISYARFVQDTNRWMREVEPLVGPTPVYVYPFGDRVPTGSAKYAYLIHEGFHVLCSVGPKTYYQWKPDCMMVDRRHIDGIALHSEQKYLQDLFDANQVIDKRRPPVY